MREGDERMRPMASNREEGQGSSWTVATAAVEEEDWSVLNLFSLISKFFSSWEIQYAE
jgi:hypothetical protein